MLIVEMDSYKKLSTLFSKLKPCCYLYIDSFVIHASFVYRRDRTTACGEYLMYVLL